MVLSFLTPQLVEHSDDGHLHDGLFNKNKNKLSIIRRAAIASEDGDWYRT